MSLKHYAGFLILIFFISCFVYFYFENSEGSVGKYSEEETGIIVRDANELIMLRNKAKIISGQMTLLINQSEGMALKAAELNDKLSNNDIPDSEKKKIEEGLMAIIKDLKSINSKLDKHKTDLFFWTDEFEKAKEEFIRKHGSIEDVIEKVKK